jgi:ATP-binding cassette, subfamily D (ALD), member 3
MGQPFSRDRAIAFAKKRSVAVVTVALLGYLINRYVQEKKKRQIIQGPEAAGTVSTQDNRGRRPKKVGVDARFLAQIKKLLPICIPSMFPRFTNFFVFLFIRSQLVRLISSYWLGPTSKESFLLITLALVLIARTWLDIW